MSNLNEAAKKVVDIFMCGEFVMRDWAGNGGLMDESPNLVLNEDQKALLESVKTSIKEPRTPANWEGPVLERMMFDAIKDLEKSVNA